MDVTNIIVSIVTAVTAVIAIIISVVEIRKSNKQSLFDRRLNAYLTVKWMKSLCDEHKSLATSYLQDGKTEPMFAIDLMFNMMTNCNYLEEIQGTLSHALESEYQRKYLLKIETLRNLCEEVRLIFQRTSVIHWPTSFSIMKKCLLRCINIKLLSTESQKNANNSTDHFQR